MKYRVDSKTDREGAFTLIELLVVMMIIGILMAVTLRAYNTVMTGAAISKAEAQLERLKTAIEEYRADRGSYPPLEIEEVLEQLNSSVILTNQIYVGTMLAQHIEPYARELISAHVLEYYPPPSYTKTILTNKTIIDPWDMPYIYGKHPTNPNKYYLFSLGNQKQLFESSSGNAADADGWSFLDGNADILPNATDYFNPDAIIGTYPK